MAHRQRSGSVQCVGVLDRLQGRLIPLVSRSVRGRGADGQRAVRKRAHVDGFDAEGTVGVDGRHADDRCAARADLGDAVGQHGPGLHSSSQLDVDLVRCVDRVREFRDDRRVRCHRILHNARLRYGSGVADRVRVPQVKREGPLAQVAEPRDPAEVGDLAFYHRPPLLNQRCLRGGSFAVGNLRMHLSKVTTGCSV